MGLLTKYVLEKDFQGALTQMADLYRWRWYHVNDSRKDKRGYPDLAMLRNGRMIHAELKRVNKHPTVDQMAWLMDYWRAGSEVYVWTPEDMDEIQYILHHPHRITTPMESELPRYLDREGHRYSTLDITKVLF